MAGRIRAALRAGDSVANNAAANGTTEMITIVSHGTVKLTLAFENAPEFTTT